ncbi:hypothetical protein SPI_04680 [Niveomyces insectorum RCEF 264]|uniref:Protein kinase-like domain protein n=1 Tax=Niveomyces insectorum RCEF 264 TaxID=1081102 RepID=A0A167UR90_9HYPO|nr:hypothetical protein SPI_04680 [Niveomyces insectorum RCEF 264]
MYPFLPGPGEELVPLPNCEGPKLKPFDFHGPQRIEFLELLGTGIDGVVFKVKILGRIYALKLFKFNSEDYFDSDGPAGLTEDSVDIDNAKLLGPFFTYGDAFNCECRAFGRLQEAGCEDAAIGCFGYVLLDDNHEAIMMEKFYDHKLDFTCDHQSVYVDGRTRFLGQLSQNKLPPIRGIVKEFGQADPALTKRLARELLRDIVRLHSLGIVNLDVDFRQVINGKFVDFGGAMTLPHFRFSPEVHGQLEPAVQRVVELELFMMCTYDYLAFDNMVCRWNQMNPTASCMVCALPGGSNSPVDGNLPFTKRKTYDLRQTRARTRFAYADPRKYDRQTALAARVHRAARTTAPPGQPGATAERTIRKRRRPVLNPPKWYYDPGGVLGAQIKKTCSIYCTVLVKWTHKDGNFVPVGFHEDELRHLWPA